MTELGQLESHWQEFAKRKVRVVVASIEDQNTAEATQADFPHLIVVSDDKRELTDVASVLHPKSAPDGGDTSTPSTLLVDGDGTVRWTFRPDWVFTRLSPTQLLAAVDKETPAE